MLLSPSVVVKKQVCGTANCKQRHGRHREEVDQEQQGDEAGPTPTRELQG
jgi:hypothetical protein